MARKNGSATVQYYKRTNRNQMPFSNELAPLWKLPAEGPSSLFFCSLREPLVVSSFHLEISPTRLLLPAIIFFFLSFLVKTPLVPRSVLPDRHKLVVANPTNRRTDIRMMHMQARNLILRAGRSALGNSIDGNRPRATWGGAHLKRGKKKKKE